MASAPAETGSASPDTPQASGEIATALLGQEVVVTLARADEEKPAVIARGTLLRWSDDGEVAVRDGTGLVHYCWPMLNIEAVSDSSGGADV